jgi:hypothetical protein
MPAFGDTAIEIHKLISEQLKELPIGSQNYEAVLHLTRMADPRNSRIETNEDVAKLLDTLIADPDTRAIVWNVALCDYDGVIDNVPSGKRAPRMQTATGKHQIDISVKDKLIARIRKDRKDIFVVGFKTTANKAPEDQYAAGLKLLKQNSLNLVIANDLGTGNNILIAPEETQYANTTDRQFVRETMVKMMLSRMNNTFTRSTVVDGEAVKWHDTLIPDNLRKVVDYCIDNGAYKPVLGKTAGHFAVKVNDETFLTSARRTDFNELNKIGLVKVVSRDKDHVLAYGRKPSVGGQSQRQIFNDHQEADCIVHFHCPPKAGIAVPKAEQWPNECGSHECGQNTSQHLEEFDLGNGHKLKMVYLDSHGPNIVFNREVPYHKITQFIAARFDLRAKTGGLVNVN